VTALFVVTIVIGLLEVAPTSTASRVAEIAKVRLSG